NALAMALFFLLDVVEDRTDIGVLELKNSRVVSSGYVFFRHQHVVAHGLVILAALGQAKGLHGPAHHRTAGLALAPLLLLVLHVGNLALQDLVYGVVVVLLLPGIG